MTIFWYTLILINGPTPKIFIAMKFFYLWCSYIPKKKVTIEVTSASLIRFNCKINQTRSGRIWSLKCEYEYSIMEACFGLKFNFFYLICTRVHNIKSFTLYFFLEYDGTSVHSVLKYKDVKYWAQNFVIEYKCTRV